MCSGCVCVEEQEPNISIASTIMFQPKMVELISYLYLYANYNAVINTEGQKNIESFQEGRQKQENKRNEKFNLLFNKEVNLEQLQNSLFLQFSACTRQIHYQFILNSNHVKLLNRIPNRFLPIGQYYCMMNIILLHFTTTRILWFVVFLCKLRLLFFKPEFWQLQSIAVIVKMAF